MFFKSMYMQLFYLRILVFLHKCGFSTRHECAFTCDKCVFANDKNVFGKRAAKPLKTDITPLQDNDLLRAKVRHLQRYILAHDLDLPSDMPQ